MLTQLIFQSLDFEEKLFPDKLRQQVRQAAKTFDSLFDRDSRVVFETEKPHLWNCYNTIRNGKIVANISKNSDAPYWGDNWLELWDELPICPSFNPNNINELTEALEKEKIRVNHIFRHEMVNICYEAALEAIKSLANARVNISISLTTRLL